MNDYVDQFISFLSDVRGASKNTVKAYRYDLNAFFLVVRKDPLQVVRTDVQQYIVHARSKGHSPKTINRRLNCLITFYAYLIEEMELDVKNPVRRDYKQKVKDKTAMRSVRIAPDEATRLLEIVKKRDTIAYVALLLMGKAGLRISEVIDLKIEHIDFERGTIFVVDSKGDDREVPLPASVRKGILETIMLRRKGNVILHSGGIPYTSTAGLWKKVRRWMVKCGVVGTPHSWRRCCGTEVYRATKDIVLVQRILGHKSIETTRQSYVDDEDNIGSVANKMDRIF